MADAPIHESARLGDLATLKKLLAADRSAAHAPVAPARFFVFASRMGDLNLGFFADGESEDPPIHEIDESGQILRQAYPTIWGFLQEMVEYYEFYRDPQRFREDPP